MRKDILLYEDNDLFIENKVNPYLNISQWEGSYAGDSTKEVLAINLLDISGNKLSTLNIEDNFKAEDLDSDSEILIYFYNEDGFGVRAESVKLLAFDENGNHLTPNSLKEIDEIGYNVYYDADYPSSFEGASGAFVVRTYEQGDFVIDNSIIQNELLLMSLDKGNLLQSPLVGVGIRKYLNTNIDRDKLLSNIRKEFTKDELVVTDADIDDLNGTIDLSSEELYGD